jgi:MoxR-like ATPase
VDTPQAPPADTHGRTLEAIAGAVEEAIRGKPEIIELALITVLARGHLLIEDIPGVGKSTMARALAQAMGGSFSRIQFTSDLLPADLLGVNVWQASKESFDFHSGPIFANVVLADEINRAPPRTQSALLEAMGERQVSVDGSSRDLPVPFTVLATQNPQEHHGTYPLPESQRDRFLMRVSMGYAAPEIEALLLQGSGSKRRAEVPAVIDAPRLIALQDAASEVFLHEDLARYAQSVVQRTREEARLRLGVSTRGALAWVAAARGRALLKGRSRVTIDDLQELAVAVLAHRVLLAQATSDEHAATSQELIRDLIAQLPVPV